MAETLGSLCDKLTILKLKQWHSQEQQQKNNILFQERLLQDEINQYINDTVKGLTPLEQLSLPSNKVYKKEGNQIQEFGGSIGEIISTLALTNCKLWHVQEKVYEFEKVPMDEKNSVIKQLAILNLERTQCIDEIDAKFHSLMKEKDQSKLDQSKEP